MINVFEEIECKKIADQVTEMKLNFLQAALRFRHTCLKVIVKI